MSSLSLPTLISLIVVALAFDFLNGLFTKDTGASPGSTAFPAPGGKTSGRVRRASQVRRPTRVRRGDGLGRSTVSAAACKTWSASSRKSTPPASTCSCISEMLGVFAEFERAIVQERVRAGLSSSKMNRLVPKRTLQHRNTTHQALEFLEASRCRRDARSVQNERWWPHGDAGRRHLPRWHALDRPPGCMDQRRIVSGDARKFAAMVRRLASSPLAQ